MYSDVNPRLIEYMESEIFPIYKTFDKGHNLDHITSVINRAFEISEGIDNLDPNIVYASAALHDIGVQVERKNHALHSAEFVMSNSKLRQFFSEDEITVIAEAVADHSTSRGVEPRSIYGKIVCDADKDNDIEISLLRAYEFTKSYFPDYSEEECYKNIYEQLVYKFGSEGKVKYWINSQKQQDFMQSMRSLAEDENRFNRFLKDVIKKNQAKNIEESERSNMKFDYSKIENYDKLLEVARSLETDEQKVFLLCNYFMANVSYNYAYLEAIRIDKESTGMEKMVQEIDSKYNAYNQDEREMAKQELKQKMREDMKSRYKDGTIAEKELQIFGDVIDHYYGTIIPARPERKIMMFGKECGVIKATPERAMALVETIRTIKNEDSHFVNPRVVEQGLLKQGVCAEFAPYVKKYFDDLGMKCEIVHGQGTVNHVWNVVNVNGNVRHLDLTNAIFIRDGYGENPTQAIPENWFMATTKEIYQMQPCRKIEKIGSAKPSGEITANNYAEFEKFIDDSIKENTQNYDR